MAQDFDLLGDPIPEGFGKRGRPAHVPTDEKRRLVMALQAFDWSIEKIAAALSITPPTLRKNYFRELKSRAEARARADAKLIAALLDQVDAGNVAAIKEMSRRFDKHDLDQLAEVIKNRGHQTRPPAEVKKGKKEMAEEVAAGVTGLFAPPSPPERLN
ncbi:helix-turn-helix domain-containing protein [Devosia sp. 63-57]|uniref:helix-turn-helix domain-containing protein n=1 Tax=Devosia sp. 63-57 TaxID=1895751 RepID=UPI000869E16F|nr:helix-turn-helix domain-containing protein [Devosia sp. 63-57]ODT50273.1 MAG: hypothetical protein ABS74_04980 [Pelagibacterium sp. SCN 63-126]ODU82737.1 MAG: hypothetical protein ABT14_16470 [Pelagibacterium sp. SCN 63-17]OJX45017.1 MAG: hypothetical protein BGO80_03980 [Devosia sp. 63-57]